MTTMLKEFNAFTARLKSKPDDTQKGLMWLMWKACWPVAQAAEREACAAVVEGRALAVHEGGDRSDVGYNMAIWDAMRAIRARGTP